jgi:hypothetical protein
MKIRRKGGKEEVGRGRRKEECGSTSECILGNEVFKHFICSKYDNN